jgi:peptide-methionine (R)-S-oxide reductase
VAVVVVVEAVMYNILSIGERCDSDNMAERIVKTDEEWKKHLTPEQYQVCRRKGTEMPFSGEYVNSKEKGIYRCIACGNELFSSDNKFDSGTGWPSFTESIKADNVQRQLDSSHGMRRIEVTCNKCGSHLGHVFDDGPEPTGNRYCINSVALKLDRNKSSSS